tara:strand:- start:131 stop:2689 length:2559 start_codon:yes stop_codon:yes gene_type:complete
MSQQLINTTFGLVGYSSASAYAQDTPNYVVGGAEPAMIVPQSVNVSGTTLEFSVFDNTTTSSRTCYIHLFGNLNSSNIPDATITVEQTENDIVDVKVTNVDISNYVGTPQYFELLDTTAVVNNGGSIPNTGVTGYGARFTTNITDTFSDLNTGTTDSGAQLFSVDFLDENQTYLSTDDFPATGTSGWLTFTQPSTGTFTNQEVVQWDAAVNSPGAPKRFARIRFKHPVDPGFEDTVLIEQDRGYDPNLDTVAIRCEEPTGWAGTNTNPTGNPQTEISPGTPTVGTLSGSFAAQTSGMITSTGDTFVIDHNNQSLLIEYDVEKDGSNFLAEPFVTFDSFEHDYNYGYNSQNPSLPDFANQAQGLTEPVVTQSNYNYYNIVNILANNTIADRRFRIKAHHPHNTNYPGGYDDYMYVIQKPQPIAWFPQNGNPTQLSGYVDNFSYTPTATSNYLSGSSLTYNTSGYEIISYAGTIVDGLAVRSTGNKAPLILAIKYGEYNQGWTVVGPGFPSQATFPGSTSSTYNTLGFTWQGAGYPTADDLNNWPIQTYLGGVYNGAGNVSYEPRAQYYDTNSNTYVDYQTYVTLANQLDSDHQCIVRLKTNAPVFKDRWFAYAVWHSDKVDYSTVYPVAAGESTYAPKAAFLDQPDDIIWVQNFGESSVGGFGITVDGVTSSATSIPNTPMLNISAQQTSAWGTSTIQDSNGVLHPAYKREFFVTGADFRVKFRVQYRDVGDPFTSAGYSPGTFGALQNTTTIDGLVDNMAGSPFGTAALQTTAIGSQTNTFENQFGVNPQHNVQGITAMDATIENQPANPGVTVMVKIPENFTGQRRRVKVIFESEWDDRHKIEFTINQVES